jgi:hypothetical protein
MEEITQKDFLKKIMIDSFVNEHKAYKKTVEFINTDLKKNNIDFQYAYDQFCIDFLKQTLSSLDDINIFNNKNYNQFYINFWYFNLYNIQSMLTEKLIELGYNYEDFFNESEITKKVKNNKKKD